MSFVFGGLNLSNFYSLILCLNLTSHQFGTCEQLDKKVAERTLREHKGDAVAAIRSLLH